MSKEKRSEHLGAFLVQLVVSVVALGFIVEPKEDERHVACGHFGHAGVQLANEGQVLIGILLRFDGLRPENVQVQTS